MRDRIVHKAAEMFLALGFKSVTMDDIAAEMGISKKTIYSHYKTKTQLVKEAVLSVFDKITCGISEIRAANYNPIEELFEMKKFAMLQLNDEKSSPQYQLQKYYPEVFQTVKRMQYEKMHGYSTVNLEKGIAEGLYRSNLSVEFVSRIYFVGVNGIKDDTLFPLNKFPKVQLMDDYLEYHLRGIVTAKGLEILKKFINEKTQDH